MNKMQKIEQNDDFPAAYVDPGVPEVVGTTALQAQTAAEIDVAIATAHKFPRSLKRFQSDATTMATVDLETAAACFYKLPRKNEDGSTKNIEGPSIRFAEIVASSYKNIRYGSRIVEIGDKFVVAQGTAHDLENNVQFMSEVRRRIVGKSGRRYSDDMIITTCNAACAIAVRNAIFKAVPIALAKGALTAAKNVAVGTSKTISARRQKALEAFKALGVSQEKVFAKLEVKGAQEITLDHLETLLGLHTAIVEGTTTMQEEFGTPEPKTTGKPVVAPTVPLSKNTPPLPAKAPAQPQGDMSGQPQDEELPLAWRE